MISRGILLHSRFHTTSLASSTCLEPPWILHSAASFWLTVDSVIEPKRGACSHCLRTCRRSGETFLQVRKRKKNRHSLSYFSLSFLIYSACPFMCPLCARYYVPVISLVAQMIKNHPAMKETWVWSLGLEDPWRKNKNPLQYSCLENSMDRGAWLATVRGVTKSWTWPND